MRIHFKSCYIQLTKTNKTTRPRSTAQVTKQGRQRDLQNQALTPLHSQLLTFKRVTVKPMTQKTNTTEFQVKLSF